MTGEMANPAGQTILPGCAHRLGHILDHRDAALVRPVPQARPLRIEPGKEPICLASSQPT